MNDLPKIRTFDDPILKQICAPVRSGEDVAWVDWLQPVCIAANGDGLAAPQIGIPKRAIFIRYGNDHGLVLINPELTQLSEQIVRSREGCLSYPHTFTDVLRHRRVFCKWSNPAGKRFGRLFKEFEAVVLQHEVDHLDGVCKVGDAWRNPPKEYSGLSAIALAAGMLAGGGK